MIRLVDPLEKSTFTIDFKGQVSISQVWVKAQIKSKPNVEPASLQQTEKKITLCSSAKTEEVQSRSILQKAFCHKDTVKDTSLKG